MFLTYHFCQFDYGSVDRQGGLRIRLFGVIFSEFIHCEPPLSSYTGLSEQTATINSGSEAGCSRPVLVTFAPQPVF